MARAANSPAPLSSRIWATADEACGTLAALHGTMPRRGPYKPVNPIGYNCINVLVQRAIGRVKAKTHQRIAARERARADPEKNRRQSKEWAANNKEKTKVCQRLSYAKNKPKRNVTQRLYRESNRQKIRDNASRWAKEKRQSDDTFVVTTRLRDRLKTFLRRQGRTQSENTMDMIGCSRDELVEHLASMLAGGQSIVSTDVDHIFPMSCYDVVIPDHQKMLMHFSNMQPLTPAENNSKRAQLPTKAMAARVERWAWPPGVTEDMLPDIYDGWSTPQRM